MDNIFALAYIVSGLPTHSPFFQKPIAIKKQMKEVNNTRYIQVFPRRVQGDNNNWKERVKTTQKSMAEDIPNSNVTKCPPPILLCLTLLYLFGSFYYQQLKEDCPSLSVHQTQESSFPSDLKCQGNEKQVFTTKIVHIRQKSAMKQKIP